MTGWPAVLDPEINPDGFPKVEGLNVTRFAPGQKRANGKAPRCIATLTTIAASDLAGLPIPPRPWHVDGLIPGRTVTGLSGDGGTNKTTLALQLCVATAAGAKWIGRNTAPGRAAFLSAEDDTDELHRRVVQITSGEGIDLTGLHDFRLIPLAGKDAVLGAPLGRTNAIQPTALWRSVCAFVEEWRPKLLVLDTLADVFAGEEISRVQSRQFVSLLRGLAIEHDLAVLVLSHPSLTGLNSGTGTSGSTGWNNSLRSRLYISRVLVDGIEPDPDLRVLTVKKSNYARTGGEIRLRWAGGLLLPEHDGGAATFEALTAAVRAERKFLELLTAYEAEGRHVSATPSANYAPAQFARDPRADGFRKRPRHRDERPIPEQSNSHR